jgi:hypothetical protein
MINDSNSIISTYENTCSATGTSTVAQVETNGCTFGDNNKIIVEGRTNISLECVQNNTTKNSIKSSIEQSMRQTAKAITQSFGFPSFGRAENFIEQSVSLGDQIVEHYYNTCLAETTSTQVGYNCQGTTFGNGNVIEVQAFTDITAKCLQNNTSINNIVSDLQSRLDQTAVAQNQNTFEIFIIIFIVIIIALAYAGVSLAESPLVEYGILFLVLASIISTVVYTITARQNNNYPYVKK